MQSPREKFIEQNLHFKMKEDVKRFFDNQTLKIEFFRSNFPREMDVISTNILITPLHTYIPLGIIDKWDNNDKSIEYMLDGLCENYESEFLLSSDLKYSFDKMKFISDMSNKAMKAPRSSEVIRERDENTMKVKTKESNYFFGLLSADPKKKSMVVRFTHMTEEMTIYNYYLEKKEKVKFFNFEANKAEDILQVLTENETFLMNIVEFYQNIFLSGKKYEKETMASITTDFRTSILEVTRTTLTYSKFKYWERSRHNIFGQIILTAMGWEMVESLDVDITKRFNYWGVDYNKTPDYVLETENEVVILDFAVTTSNAGQIRENKVKKYEDLRNGLSQHLKKSVKVEAVVWKINQKDEFQIPDFMSEITSMLIGDETLEFLFNVHLSISMMKDYNKFRMMTDIEAEEDDMNLNLKKAYYDSIINSKLSNKKNMNNYKVHPIEESRTKTRRLDTKKVHLQDSTFYKEMKEEKVLSTLNYKENLMKKMNEALNGEVMSPDLKVALSFDKNKLKSLIHEEKERMLDLRMGFESNSNWKIPKTFKFPFVNILQSNMPEIFKGHTPDFWNMEKELDDGTLFYSSTMDYEHQKLEELDKAKVDYNVDGIGFNEEEDVSIMESLIEFLMESRRLTGSESMTFDDETGVLDMLKKTKVWEILEFWSDLVYNLSYLDGRRHIFDKNKGHTVFKNFGEYMLLIKKGSKLTAQKQIRFKIVTHKKNIIIDNQIHFHKWEDIPFTMDMVWTKWLSITVTDIRHFLKVKEVAVNLLSDLMDKFKENNRGASHPKNMINKSYMTQLVILLEHKRGTSTTCQLNRYLVNSATSYISNREKLITDINADPIRSRVEAYIRILQMNWFSAMTNRSERMWFDKIISMPSTKTDYDRLYMPSLYDLDSEVEFAEIMNEMYTCNMFDKEAGFMEHRVKRVVDKMTTAELHYISIQEKDESKGNIEDYIKFWGNKDELHQFDKNFVISATRNYFDKKVNKIKVKEAVMNALNTTIDNAMMMTSSLVSGPYSSEAFEYSNKIKKTKTFISLYNEISNMSTNLLSELVDKYNAIDAVFTVFPKSQIGGPREILIQSVQLRIMVKFLENISREYCKIHEKEMMTKDKKKAEIQSDKMSEYKEILRNIRKKGEVSVFASLNADSSKWAPGFVMEHFMYFVNNWELPDELKNMMLSVISAFSNKRVMVPETLKEKWNKKDKNEKEYMEGVQYFREESDNLYGTVIIRSGMGQGMLHALSSFYHCVMDDYVEELSTEILYKRYGAQVAETSLISSDDKTKMTMFVFKKGVTTSELVMKEYIKLQDMLIRLANIHINWKKSGFNFVITEFNSLFSIGKRMLWATVKDMYTSNSLPDLSSPEEAVMFMNSNIRRCLEHGMFFPTLKLMIRMAREQLKKYYRYDNKIIQDLMNTLDCKEEQLPFQIGFYPTNLAIETLMYGLEVNMFDQDLSEKLKLFYRNTYSAKPSDSYKIVRNLVPFSEASAGKFWFELPTRLDKRLMDLKKEFFEENIKMEPEEVLKDMDVTALSVNLKRNDMRHYIQFTKEFFVGMKRKYEFQETMVVHSLIRALQLSRGKGVVFPKDSKYIELDDNIKELKNNIKFKLKKEERVDDDTKKLFKLEEELLSYTHDAKTYVEYIMSRKSENSSLYLYNGLKKVVDIHYQVLEELKMMKKSTKFMHSTMKAMRFYLTDIGMSAKSSEILNYLFDVGSDFRNSTVQSVNNILNLSGKTFDYDIYKNPFQFVKDFMKNSEYPNKSFKDYLSLNYKSMNFLKIVMLSDTPCMGNMKDNMLNLYRTKSNPSFVFEVINRDYFRQESALEFLTKLSLNQPLAIIPEVEEKEACMIDQSDNIMIRAMKLHSLSQGKWVSTSNLDYNRVEYRQYKDNKNNSLVKHWTDMKTMAKAVEFKNKVELHLWTDSILDKDNKSPMLISILRRYLDELEEKNMKVYYMTKRKYSELYNLHYDTLDLKFMTEVKYNITNWTLKLNITNREELEFNRFKLNCQEYNILTDRYTVDDKTLMEIEVLDQYNETVRVQDLMNDIPDILSLDKIFLKNNWIQEIKLPEGAVSEREDKDKFKVSALNESFGMSNIHNTLSSMFDLSALRRETEDIEEEDTIVMEKVPETSIMNTVMSAFLKVEDSGDELTVEYSPYERNSIMKEIDYLTTASVRTSITVYKDKMKEFIQYVKRSNRDMSVFHNMLLWQIRDAFDYNISDTMLVVVYNIILKGSVSTLEMMPATSLKKYGPEMKTRFKESVRFLKLVEHFNEDYEQVMDQFGF